MSLFALSDEAWVTIVTNATQTLILLMTVILAALGYRRVNGWVKDHDRRQGGDRRKRRRKPPQK